MSEAADPPLSSFAVALVLCAVLAAGLWLRRRRRRRPSGVEAAREAVRSLLARRTAKQVMVPRDRIDYLSLERPIADNLAVVEKTRRTRYPLCETGLDTISGVVHIKQLLPRLHTLTSSDELLLIQQPALFVPESQPLDVLLASFRAQRSGMAVVVDEHGIPTGIVTLDDVLEEIAGDVRDETAPATPPEFVETDNGVEVDGMVLVEDLCHRLSLESLRDGGLDTVGGYVCKALGRIPRPGERFTLADYEGEVREMKGRRVARVLLRPAARAAGAVSGHRRSAPRS